MLTSVAVGFYTRSLALVADAFHYVSFPCTSLSRTVGITDSRSSTTSSALSWRLLLSR